MEFVAMLQGWVARQFSSSDRSVWMGIVVLQ